MTVLLTSIADAGNLEKERLVLKVSSATDIGQYAMFRSRVRDDKVTTGITHVFWFPDQSVADGDFVILYTKGGNSRTRSNDSGTTSYFYYWGEDEPLWKTPEFSAVFLHVDRWQSRNPSEG